MSAFVADVWHVLLVFWIASMIWFFWHVGIPVWRGCYDLDEDNGGHNG